MKGMAKRNKHYIQVSVKWAECPTGGFQSVSPDGTHKLRITRTTFGTWKAWVSLIRSSMNQRAVRVIGEQYEDVASAKAAIRKWVIQRALAKRTAELSSQEKQAELAAL